MPRVCHLFSPVTFPTPDGAGLQARNRSFLAPMCQYSVTQRNGVPNDWHLSHLGAMAAGGFGIVTVEATAVQAIGRISPEDVGLWDDAQVPAHRRIVDFVHKQGALAAVQLGHAGGKASTYPWLPGAKVGSIPLEDGGWTTVAPTDRPVAEDLAAPQALDAEGIRQVVADFADAARRADAAGYDIIQLHGAHGYLLHQFLSPITNTRTDQYGGSEENRALIVREVADAVRAVWPDSKPLGIRLSGTDWVAEQDPGADPVWDVETAARLALDLQDHHGVSWFDLSSGGLGSAPIPVGPGYQVRLADRVREALHQAPAPASGQRALVSAVGLIENAQQAETILATGQADAVSIARAALRDPHWPAASAAELGVPREKNPASPPLWRAGW